MRQRAEGTYVRVKTLTLRLESRDITVALEMTILLILVPPVDEQAKYHSQEEGVEQTLA